MDTASLTDVVDPRSPLYRQFITALGLAAGIALREPVFVYAVAVILVVSALSEWRLDFYAYL